MPRMIDTITSVVAAPCTSASAMRTTEPRGNPCDARPATIMTAPQASASAMMRGSSHDHVLRVSVGSTAGPPRRATRSRGECKASLSTCQGTLTDGSGAGAEHEGPAGDAGGPSSQAGSWSARHGDAHERGRDRDVPLAGGVERLRERDQLVAERLLLPARACRVGRVHRRPVVGGKQVGVLRRRDAGLEEQEAVLPEADRARRDARLAEALEDVRLHAPEHRADEALGWRR